MRQMLAAREVGHHAAVGFVECDLAVHPLAGQAVRRVEDGHRRLVAGTFEGEDHDEEKPES
jgi:hypothetical protein